MRHKALFAEESETVKVSRMAETVSRSVCHFNGCFFLFTMRWSLAVICQTTPLMQRWRRCLCIWDLVFQVVTSHKSQLCLKKSYRSISPKYHCPLRVMKNGDFQNEKEKAKSVPFLKNGICRIEGKSASYKEQGETWISFASIGGKTGNGIFIESKWKKASQKGNQNSDPNKQGTKI